MQDASRLHHHHSEEPVGVAPGRRTIAVVVLCLCAYEARIEATVDLTITLAFWMLLRAAMSVERAGDLAVTATI